MDIDLHGVVTVVSLVVAGVALSACTVLGTGRSTLVLATEPAPKTYHGTEFAHLIETQERKLVGLQGKAAASTEDWGKFRNERLGGDSGAAAEIGINVRDQTNTPALDLFNIETLTAADTAKILTDRSLSPEQKDALLTELRDNFRGMPESYSRLVGHGVDKNGGIIYHYFPQVTIDLSGTLNTPEPLDRFDFLAAAIRIPAAAEVKFINFSPKAADLFDFTLGQMKQTANLTAAANASNKATIGHSQTVGATGGPQTGDSTGAELNYGGSLNFALGDEFTRDMKSSLEARSAGILDDGRLFLIELRSNEQKRIAGTYTFNVMLEVASTVTKTTVGSETRWTSRPNVDRVEAEVRVVGIVRHVVKPGKAGTFKRVPEPLNDTTFRQVVLHDSKALLWEFTNVPTAQIATDPNLTIYSNIEGATFTVYDEKTGAVLEHGGGRETQLSISTPNTVRVVFHPVIVGGDKPVALKALEARKVRLGENTRVVGSYLP